MRIISGRFRGTQLASVGTGDVTAHLRPTSDKVRGAIFNLLAHGDYPPIEGMRVLDLFAGSGALGFEALSRGAAHACFVDTGAKAGELIRANAERLQVTQQISLLKRDATKLGTCSVAPFQLIFLDPPYGKALGENALVAAQSGGWLTKDAVVVWEENSNPHIPLGFINHDQRSYGDTKVTILQAAE